MMKITSTVTQFIIISIFLLSANELKSQFLSPKFNVKDSSRVIFFQAAVGFDMLLPRFEHRGQNDNIGLGFGLSFGTYSPKIPIVLGADFSYITFGDDDWSKDMVSTLYCERHDIASSYYMHSLGLFLRIQPHEGDFLPFIEVFSNYNWIYTYREIDYSQHVYYINETTIIHTEGDLETEIEDDVSGYGIGGGFVIPFKIRKGEIFLELNMKYNFAGVTRYLKKGSIKLEKNNIVFDYSRSRIDSYSMRLGFGFRI